MKPQAVLSIVGFEEIQHYKKRSPPWIKLHQDWWNNPAFERLPDATKAHFIGLCMLASRHNNAIPCDLEWIARKLSSNVPIDIRCLIASGLLASSKHLVLAECKQDASPEKRREEVEERQIPTFGQFANVRLSDDEKVKLEMAFGVEGTTMRIEALSEYMASRTTKYKNHYAVILSWERKNGDGKSNGFKTTEQRRSERSADAVNRVLREISSNPERIAQSGDQSSPDKNLGLLLPPHLRT